MRKKSLIRAFVLALLMLCTTVATANAFEVRNIYYNILSEEDRTVEVTGGFNNSGCVEIPESVTYNGTTYSVTSIGRGAFSHSSWLTSIEIPNSVTSIRESAFYNCSGLTSVEIGNNVTSIGFYAFYGCSGLTSITIPNSVTSIDDGAFCDCSGLTSITIPNSITSIGERTFYDCSALTSIVIPNSVTSIGYMAFFGCTGLTSIEIPNSVTSIRGYAFDGTAWYNNQPAGVVYAGKVLYKYKGTMPENTSIIIKDGTLGIGEYAFARCDGLTSVEIPNSVISIRYSFRDCSGLTSIVVAEENTVYDSRNNCNAIIETATNKLVTGCKNTIIPNSVTSIGDYAFYYCSGLTSITIPNSVTSIGESAFYECNGLTSITIPNSVTSIGYCAFYKTAWYNNQPDGVVYAGKVLYEYKGTMSENTSITIKNGTLSIGEYAFYECDGLKSVEIPNSVISIGDNAFYECDGLTSVVIGNSVTSIGDHVFRHCDGLTSIVVADGNTVYDSRNNCNAIIETATNKLVTGCKNTIIPNSVTSIGDYAFYYCSGLTSIEIPNNVTSIGEHAFYECNGLTNVVIGNSVTSIGEYAFYECDSLTCVVIGNSVTSIGEYAFCECHELKTVINLSDLTFTEGSSDNGWVAYDADKVINATNGSMVNNFVFSTSNGIHTLFAYIGTDNEITLPDNCNGESYAIGAGVFMNNTAITSVVIPNGVTSIGAEAFFYCTGLTSVEIPNSVTRIGESAFEGTAWYHNHPDGLVYAGKVLYKYKGTMPENIYITIKDGTSSIGESAFYYYSGLTSVEIPNSVTSIENNAFRGCTGLTSVTSHISAENLFALNSSVFKGVDKSNCTLYVPYGAKETYTATEGWNEFTNIVELEPVTEVTVTINQYGSATYCSPYALDFSEVEDLKAYAATGYNTSSQVVTLTRVQTTKQGTGLFLMAEPGEYVVPVIETSNDYTLNLLVGTLKETTVNRKSDDGNYINFKYTVKDDNEPAFYQFEENSSLSAYKAYLQLPASLFPGAVASESVSVRFDNGTTTDIDDVVGENGEGKTIYDFSGRMVENPTSGIYIIDGKKVFIKK